MSYLDRLKQLDSGKNFHFAPEPEPTKPTEPPFDAFVGSTPGANEKISSECEVGMKLENCVIPEPTKPTEGIEATYWHWIVELPDRVIETFHHPAATRAEVLLQYQDAVDLEPISETPGATF